MVMVDKMLTQRWGGCWMRCSKGGAMSYKFEVTVSDLQESPAWFANELANGYEFGLSLDDLNKYLADQIDVIRPARAKAKRPQVKVERSRGKPRTTAHLSQKAAHLPTVRMKHCGKCKGRKPATTDHFSKNGKAKDGLENQCKVCKSKYDKERREEQKKRKRIKLLRGAGGDQTPCQHIVP